MTQKFNFDYSPSFIVCNIQQTVVDQGLTKTDFKLFQWWSTIFFELSPILHNIASGLSSILRTGKNHTYINHNSANARFYTSSVPTCRRHVIHWWFELACCSLTKQKFDYAPAEETCSLKEQSLKLVPSTLSQPSVPTRICTLKRLKPGDEALEPRPGYQGAFLTYMASEVDWSRIRQMWSQININSVCLRLFSISQLQIDRIKRRGIHGER